MQLDDLLNAITSKTGKALRKSGNSYSCCCPSRDDTNPSLSIVDPKKWTSAFVSFC